MNLDLEILNNTNKSNLEIHKKSIHHNQLELILGTWDWLTIWKPVSVIHYIKMLKEKIKMWLCSKYRKIISQNSIPIQDKKKIEKVLSNLGINDNFLNLIKVVCQKPQNATVVNIFKDETLSALPSKDQVQSKDTHPHQFCSILSWCSILCNKARKKNKKHNGWKGKSKITSIHRWYDYTFSKFEASTEQVWEQIGEFIKAAEYKVKTQSQLNSCLLVTNNWKMKSRKWYHIQQH